MSRKLVAGNSKENSPTNKVVTVTDSQASTIARLLQWKKHNYAKREVKARLQEDARVEEEESFLSLLKPLPQGQVQAAAIRNYRAAGELHWKKLMLQTVAEQQYIDEEEAECTFRPHLVAQPRRSVGWIPSSSKVKSCRPCCTSSSNNSTSTPAQQPVRRRVTETNGDVFERLYKPQADAQTTVFQCASSTIPKRISSRAEAAFIARQERDLVDRQRRRSERAAQQRFPHKPKLSRHTQEICAGLREAEADTGTCKLVDHCEKSSARQVRYTVPACTSLCKSNVASAPFNSLVKALQQQEKRMRCISKCA